MTNKQKKQFNEYIVREVARRVVPMALEATGTSSCLKQAKKLRKLADDASMTEVEEVCSDAVNTARGAAADARVNYYAAYAAASDAARAAANTARAAKAASDAAFEAARAASGASDADVDDAYASGVAYSAYVAAGAHSTYSDILMEVAKRMPANAVPIIPDLHRKMYDTVTLPGHKLEMNAWHTCKTTHCRAGWATVLGGDAGKALEKAFGHAVAGGLIYAVNTGMVPDFYDTNDESALADMKLAAQAS